MDVSCPAILPDPAGRVAVLWGVFPVDRAPLHGSRMATEVMAASTGGNAVGSGEVAALDSNAVVPYEECLMNMKTEHAYWGVLEFR